MKGRFQTDRAWPWSKLAKARSTLLISDPDRLIGMGRLVTACFAILAIWLDPTQPARYRPEAEHLLAFYLVLSIALLVIPIRRPVDSWWHFGAHAADTVILGWLAFLTNELTSPFFSFLPFTLMAMTMRWGLAGAIIGMIQVQALLFVVGIPDIFDGESELNLLIVRSAFLALAGLMLGYFGAYRESSRERLTRLAHWPMEPMLGSRPAWLAELCSHAGSVTGSERMVVIWHEHDTGDGFVAVWSDETVVLRDLRGAGTSEDLAAATIEAIDRGDAWVMKPAALAAIAPKLAQLRLPDITPRKMVVAAGFSGLRLGGAVLIVDPDCLPEDAVTLSGIIAARIGAELEHLELLNRYADGVRTEERNRLAHDLHDSVLQDLTATSLKLHALAAATPDRAGQLGEIEMLVIEQQRRIRRFVEDHRDCDNEALVEVSDELRRHAELLQKKWDVAVPFAWEGHSALLPRSRVEALIQLCSEATSNAVRHGAASSVRVGARVAGAAVELTVADNGTGLDPTHDGFGSVSLRARMQQLGGAMSISDRAPGLAVRLIVPVEELAA